MFRNYWLIQVSQRWFQRGTERRRRAPRVLARKRRPVKPRLEVLEDRLVLSATITDLATPPGDAITDVFGINSSGQVVGDMTSSSSSHLDAFVDSNGQITNLGTLPGVQGVDAYGINSPGQVVGDNGSGVAFLYSDGQMTDLNTLLPANSGWKLDIAKAINDSGQIVGNGFDSNSSHSGVSAFLYSNGQITDLGTLPGDNGAGASAINSSGQVVGTSFTIPATGGNDVSHAFLYSNNKMTALGTLPGYTESDAIGINDSGQVAGDSINPGSNGGFPTYQATLYSNGQLTALGTLPGDTESVADGINSSGQVVGDSFTSIGASHAFLYSNGQMIDLNSLLPANSGWVIEDAKAINDSGEIVGDGTLNGQGHAFLLNLNLNVSLSPASLPAGVENNSYTQTIAASGGIGDITLSYKVTSGTIPDGLTFTPKTNELDISGTPTATGTVTFTVTATDSASPPNSTTQTYTLTVNAGTAPGITGNPSNQTVTAGTNVSFTASATGNPTPTVQWQVSTDGGKTWSNGNLPSSTTITVANVTLADNGTAYRAVFTNSAGSATSTAATLTVNAPIATAPAILSGNGAGFTIGQGGNFLVTTSGSPTPTLTESGALPSGVTFIDNGNGTASLQGTPGAGTQGTYHFTIAAQNSAGSLTQSFTLTVNPAAPIVPPVLAFFDSLLGGTEIENADGTQTITDSFFGFPLLTSTFDSSGNLQSVLLFGINVTLLFELL